jgi:tRNA A-37 threonylcarbamoyl transferase component Bud32
VLDEDRATIGPATVVGYLRGRGVIDDGPAEVAVIGGGVSNIVIAVATASRRVVFKQALGRLRVADEWLADPKRALAEARALEIAGELSPGTVPRVLDVDPGLNALTIEASPAAWRPWKEALLAGEVDLRVGRRLGELLAGWHRGTTGLRSELDEWPLFEQLRIDPYYRAVGRRHPDLAQQILWYADELEARRSCLVHGDFSPKNVLVGDGGPWVIDFEVAHYGDPVFDLAFLTSHLVLKAIARPVARSALFDCADVFHASYRAVQGAAEAADPTYVFGHVGCLMLARVDGNSPVDYLDDGQRERTRALARSIIAAPPARLSELAAALDASA